MKEVKFGLVEDGQHFLLNYTSYTPARTEVHTSVDCVKIPPKFFPPKLRGEVPKVYNAYSKDYGYFRILNEEEVQLYD